MNYKEALFFIGECLLANNTKDNKIQNQIKKGKVNWEMLVQVASSHLVFPSLYIKLVQYLPNKLIPNDFIIYGESIYNLNLNRNQQIIDQAQAINTVLTLNKIRPVFLKGVACLFDNIYTNQGERMIGDIDILVNEMDFARSVEVLKSSDYVQSHPFDKTMINHIKHYPRLIHQNKIAAVEIHRQPVNLKYTSILNCKTIFSDAHSSIDNKNIFVPHDKHKLQHSFIHSQLSNKANYYGTIFLKDCYEFYLIKNRLQTTPEKIRWPYNLHYTNYQRVVEIVRENPSKKKINFQLYYNRVILNLRFKKWQVTNTLALYVIQKFMAYFSLLLKSIFIKSYRKNTLLKLTNTVTLKNHYQNLFSELKRIFKGMN